MHLYASLKWRSLQIAMVCVILLTGCTYAQMQIQSKPVAADAAFLLPDRVNDTLARYYERKSDLFEYSITNEAGYVFGTGWDMEKKYLFSRSLGMHYDGVQNARVVEVLVMFYKAVVVGDAGTVTAKVCWVDKDTVPTEELGASTRSIADLDTVFNHFTSFPIDNAANTEGKPFLVAIEYGDNVGEPSIIDDTVGVLGNDSEKHDGKGENRTRQFFYFSGAWKSLNAVFNDMDCDAMIIPVIDFTTESDKMVSSKGVGVVHSFVTIQNRTAHIRYFIDRSRKVAVRIFTLSGKNILDTGFRCKKAGNHDQSVRLDGVSSGSYYYTISTEGASLTGKMVCIK